MDSSRAVKTRKKTKKMKVFIKAGNMRKRVINDKKIIKPIYDCQSDEDFLERLSLCENFTYPIPHLNLKI